MLECLVQKLYGEQESDIDVHCKYIQIQKDSEIEKNYNKKSTYFFSLRMMTTMTLILDYNT